MRIVFVLALLCAGCTLSDDKTRKVLRAAGYTNIRLTGYPFMSCDKRDDFNQGFVATSVSGARVTGAVCCGMLKNCTVRVEEIHD